MDLFTVAPKAPLAELLRPKTLDEVAGQSHLLGPGRALRMAFESKKPHSFILWGPPGVGKTTLARLSAHLLDCEFIALSAVMAGVKDIRDAVAQAQGALDRHGRRSVVFIDEIHRFNKAQQDALLPYVEAGLITFIGATTENPSLSVVSALLSRAQVYTLESLTHDDLAKLFERAKSTLDGLTVEPEALAALIRSADGDARRFLNLLEQVQTNATQAGLTAADLEFVKSTTAGGVRRFDNGDTFYDQISALQKSIRGSSPDAALYWLARMLDGGADARTIARRMVVMASEDVGNADPRALQVAVAAADAYAKVGSPEGDLNLAHAAVYLAMAPKSNAVYTAWKAARAFVRQDSSREVPMHLRNAPTQLMKDLGYHAGYRYAHDEPGGYAAGENYLPVGISEPNWYQPVERGLELKIGERLQQLKALDAAARSKTPPAR